MKKLKYIIKITVGFLLIGGMTGCNAWMDIYPENQQTSDNFWRSKEEVEEVLMGAYSQLCKNSRQFIQWGELRGDGISLGASEEADEKKIKDLEITPSNPIAKWSGFYRVIARANAVIAYSDRVLDQDITFTPKQSQALIAEAVFLRSLCYFYLVRTFGGVPLVLSPYVDDSQEYDVPISSGDAVLNQVVKDLEYYGNQCKYVYEGTWQRTGRATRWAYYALLADIHLWQGNYEEVLRYCDLIDRDGKFALVGAEDWYTIFYPGNSSESIFELQWSEEYKQKSSFYTWFFGGTDKSNYLVTSNTRELFEGDMVPSKTDVRGPNNSYLITTDYSDKIWKYSGIGKYTTSDDIRSSTERDANWIFYRYSEIVLMRIEALAMRATGGDLTQVARLLEQFRSFRGNVNTLPVPENSRSALLLVMEERQREFIGEGKRWFDILRVARRHNYAEQQYVKDILLEGVDAKYRPKWESRLADTNAYYLPVHEDEVDNSNGVVVQNPYYANQE